MTTYVSDASYSVVSVGNSTSAPLGSSATFTGSSEQNPYPDIFLDIRTDADCIVYSEFSIDGSNWARFPVNGYALRSINNWTLVDRAVKGGRYFRLVIENGAAAQTFLRAQVQFGVFGLLNTPLVQSLSENSGAIATRPTIAQDEISRGLRGGVGQFNKFGYRDNLQSGGGAETIWASSTTSNNLQIMTAADTFTITYDNTTDGSAGGANGAKSLTFYYLDANEKLAVAQHVLGSTGSDVTAFSGLGINRCVVTQSGSSNTNENDIRVDDTGGATMQAILPAGGGVTQQCVFFAPDNETPVAKWLYISANKLSGSNPKVVFKGYVYNRTVDSQFEIFRHTIDTQSDTSATFTDPCNFPLSPRDVLFFAADTDQNNTAVECRFSVNIYSNQ